MTTIRRTVWCSVILIGGTSALGTFLLVTGVHPDRPDIYVPNQTVDLGVIDGLHHDPNTPRHISFRIENRGTGVLKLLRLHAACRCTMPRLGHKVLSPGETTTLTMRVGVPNRPGEFVEKVLLNSNDTKHPVTELLIKGFVHRPCYVLPESVIVNGLRANEERRIELEVTGPDGDKSFTIAKVWTTTDGLRLCKIEDAGTASSSTRPVCRILLTAVSHGRDAWEDTIYISTSDQESPLIEVPVKVRELPLVKIEPALVILRAHADTETLTAQVEISTNTLKPMTIIDVERPDWVDLRFEPDTKKLPARLHLTASKVPDKMKPFVQEVITLKLGEPCGEVRIPLVVVLGGPEATISQGAPGNR